MPKICVGGESFSVSLISGIEKFYASEGYVTIFDFLSKFFSLTVPKNLVGEPFCAVFQKISCSEKFMDKRGGGVWRFSVEIFMSHGAEKFRGHPFNVSESLGYRKNLCLIGGVTIFRRKFFVSQCRKILWASVQCFRKFGVSKNFMLNRGYHNFPSKIFCLTVPKNFVGIRSMFQKIWGIEKFYA